MTPLGKCEKVRSLLGEMSRPNIIENAETKSALSWRHSEDKVISIRNVMCLFEYIGVSTDID